MHYQNRLCFMGNQSKTAFFQRIAGHLDRRRTRVSWIVVNAAQREVLRGEYDDADILYLPLSTRSNSEPLPIKINDLVFSDRRLKFMPERGLDYMRAIQRPIIDFLDAGLPTLVVGELTYAYEVLTYRLVQEYLPRVAWVSPFLTRVPAGRFAFFSDEAFSREVWPPPDGGLPLPDIAAADEQIGYVEMNRKHIARQDSAAFLIGKLRRFMSLRDFDPEDPTWKSNSRREKLVKNMRWWVNRRSYARIRKVGLEAITACKGRSVIFPLHLQPELNIDTCGRYWDNQAETILKIWRQLGPDDALFIKEHPVAIGNRGRAWFERLLAFPNLYLLHHAVPVPELLEAVDYVFTISGTMGLEAALGGGKVLCLAPTTYDRLENVVSPTIADFRGPGTIDDLYARLRAAKSDAWSLTDYLAHLERYAYHGDPEGDRIANPDSWRPRNLACIAAALEHVLSEIERAADGGETDTSLVLQV